MKTDQLEALFSSGSVRRLIGLIARASVKASAVNEVVIQKRRTSAWLPLITTPFQRD